ncbi:Poly [ADP-ribose] polymerase 1 [Ophiophagus hannah]|uniref:Poly [ADP-ribose] polymerase n=1 Tax=Ophiophagus hannah TaxID=8665 RepID=V8P5I0_OPHHA|nr:Poly [ADP-ribose] polymerase 1 [Ophiophagus hannah]
MAEPVEKLYRAEYAKSGRASCKKCKENIAKDSLRLAIMVQSPMFDGKIPHWHHYSCFWERAQLLSHADLDGFSELRWEDQEKIKKHIESGGAAAGKGGGQEGGGKREKSLNDFAAEYAKSNRSTCKGCEQKIEKGQIRISKKMVLPEKPQLGMIDNWYHLACFSSRRTNLGFLPTFNASQIQGFELLKAEDKETLKKQLPSVKNEGKRKGDEVDANVISKKRPKKEKEKLSKQEKLIKDQTELIWNIKDELKKACSANDLKELLIANKQKVPSGEAAILDCVADGMAFGALLPCEECKGQFVFKSNAYYCTGYITAWTKCVANTQMPNRKKWTIPKEFREIPYLKKFKFKKQDRAFLPEAVSTNSVPPSAVSDPITENSAAPADKPLNNMKIVVLGKLSKTKDEIKSIIEELGGKVTVTVNKADLCISSQKEVEKMNKKMEEVKKAHLCVVSEDFLQDIKSSSKGFQELRSLHAVSPWGAEVKQEHKEVSVSGKSSGHPSLKNSGKNKEEQGTSKSEKKMKLTVKGGAAVDPDSGLEDSAHVFEKSGKIFSATLGLVDIVQGTNSYYKLQLLEDDRETRYWVFRSWGRVGTSIGSNKLEKMPSKEEAIEHFLDLYEEKTGNSWHSKNFTKYPKKFYPLEIDYGQDEEAVKKLTVSAGTKSKLPKAVQDLIKMIFDIESMKKAMVEFEIDLQKMPLGKLSERQIQSAYSILNEVQQAVSDGGTDSQILDLSNRFYTLIPHDFGMKKPPLLNNLDYIKTKVEMLDNLLDIEVAYSLLRSGSQDGDKDPIDVNYEKLKTNIQVVDKDSEEAKIIKQYVKNTHASTHNAYDLKVMEIFKIERDGEYQRYEPFRDLHNRQLLWHGSRTTNFAGILFELKNASHITKLPKGKHSVKGSSAKALVSLKEIIFKICNLFITEGSLSNTWNEKFSSLQKTPIWKGKNAGATVEMPFRNSKRTRSFCEEDERQMNTRSPKRNQRVGMVPQKFTVTVPTPDKKASQKIGLRLRNLLKLPKAHKWCIYEWFYSNIDKPLFEGDNDFCVCLKESFPNLKTRKLTRVEWGKIRRLMGKPRRCSSAFFEEERSALKQKRQKIRLLQQRKVADISQFKDLPEEIPLPLVIGTKVTARLRGSHDGLFTGQIDAVDTLNATYRVTFERTGLGTHTIPDYEVLDSDPLLGSSWKNKISGSDSETLGGFPVEFLIQVTRLSKILMIKKEHIKQLREMNTEAEKLKSYSMPIGIEFQRRYATIVLDLEQLNKDLNKVLHKVQQYCYELAPEQGLQPSDHPTDLRRRCEEEAQEINCFSFFSCFQNNVEIHVAHIQSGLSQMGNLHAFAANNTNRD